MALTPRQRLLADCAALARDHPDPSFGRLLLECAYLRLLNHGTADDLITAHRRLFSQRVPRTLLARIAGLLVQHPFDLFDPGILADVHEHVVEGVIAGRRHGRGVFYTPDAEVRLMCQLALAEWLANHLDPDARTALFDAIFAPDEAADRQLARLDLWPQIDERLRGVTILDPACGAGCFLAGMLDLLVDLSTRAARRLGRPGRPIEHILTHSLHGIDASPTACHAARLRLLSGHGRQRANDESLAEAHGLKGGTPHLHHADFLLHPPGEFDIVIANPPYVRKEQIAATAGTTADYKRALHRAAARAFPDFFANCRLSGHCDLYVHFFIAGLAALRPRGVLCFITSNSWLDAAYSAALRQLLIRHADLRLVLQSRARRSFASADVNTAITLLSRPPGSVEHNAITRFVSLDAPLDRAAAVWCSMGKVSLPPARILPISQHQLRDDDGKWGGHYLRAPDIYHQILRRAAAHLVRLSERCRVQGYIHDNNTGDEFPPAPFLKSVRLAQTIRLAPDSPGVTTFGVNSRGQSRRPAPVLFPRTFGTRHLVLFNTAGVLAKEFYKILPRPGLDPQLIAAQLNSTFAILQRELLGLVNFGDGAIKFSIADIGLFLLICNPPSDALLSAFAPLAARPILDLPDELQQPDRRALDAILFDVLDLTTSERESIYAATLDLVQSRQFLARSI